MAQYGMNECYIRFMKREKVVGQFFICDIHLSMVQEKVRRKCEIYPLILKKTLNLSLLLPYFCRAFTLFLPVVPEQMSTPLLVV